MPRLVSICAAAWVLALPAALLGAREPMAPGRIVFLLEYVGSDYGLAVEDGRVANAFEYAEMLDFTRMIAEEVARSRPGAPAEIAERLAALRRLVGAKAPPEDVRAMVAALVPMLAGELSVAAWPERTPDVSRGRALFASDCAPCHGERGGGDGWAASGMSPPATSFRDPRMEHVSPHQIAGAVRFGIQGTAMPSYEGARADDEIWDLAFYVSSLRTKAQNVARSAPVGAPSPAPAGVAAARELERAFTSVAERVFPSVVGITALRRGEGAPDVASGRTTRAGGWQRSQSVLLRHPGFVPVGVGSGFFVSEDGTVLTDRHFLIDPETGRPAERIEVELDNDRRPLAHVLGIEPMIDLAVLKVGAPGEMPAVELGDSEQVQLGQWIIALGDPPGVDRTFTAGSLSAVPRRECYQEEPDETLFQTSLWIEAGGFGGPVVDLDGRVIGLAQPPPGMVPVPGAPSALRILPIGLALTIYESLASEAESISPWLGFSVLELSRDLRQRVENPPRTGVYIDDVHDPSPAWDAGVRAGDVLSSIDGNRLLSVADFQRWLYLSGVGKTVELGIYRQGKRVLMPVAIEQRPAELVPTAPGQPRAKPGTD